MPFKNKRRPQGSFTAIHASQKRVQLPSFMSKHAEIPALISATADVRNVVKQRLDKKNLSRPTVRDAV